MVISMNVKIITSEMLPKKKYSFIHWKRHQKHARMGKFYIKRHRFPRQISNIQDGKNESREWSLNRMIISMQIGFWTVKFTMVDKWTSWNLQTVSLSLEMFFSSFIMLTKLT